MKFDEKLFYPHSYNNIIHKHVVLLTIQLYFHAKIKPQVPSHTKVKKDKFKKETLMFF